MSLRVDYDERAIDQAAAFLDDPPGIRAVLDAIDQLAHDPRPAGSFPYGSLHLGSVEALSARNRWRAPDHAAWRAWTSGQAESIS